MPLLVRVIVYRDTDPDEILHERTINVFPKLARWGLPNGGIASKDEGIRLKGCLVEFWVEDLTKAQIAGVDGQLC